MNIFKLKKSFEDLSNHAFQQKIAETSDAVILDVRTPGEFQRGRLPRAINIDVTDKSFADKVTSLDTAKTYFVYCRSGGRSGQACAILSELGFKGYNLAGCILNWNGKII